MRRRLIPQRRAQIFEWTTNVVINVDLIAKVTRGTAKATNGLAQAGRYRRDALRS